MGGVFYFLLIRPQQKRVRAQQALLSSVEVGDEIVTTAGIFGTIVDDRRREDIVTRRDRPWDAVAHGASRHRQDRGRRGSPDDEDGPIEHDVTGAPLGTTATPERRSTRSTVIASEHDAWTRRRCPSIRRRRPASTLPR